MAEVEDSSSDTEVSHAIIKVDSSNVEEVSKKLQKFFKENKSKKVETQVAEVDNFKAICISAGAEKEELGFILEVTTDAELTIFHVVNQQEGIKTVSVDLLKAKTKVWAGKGAGIGLSANLIDAKASVFDLKLGVALDTEAGIQDQSVVVKFLGTGFTIGRKVGVSASGVSVGVDFGRCSVM